MSEYEQGMFEIATNLRLGWVGVVFGSCNSPVYHQAGLASLRVCAAMACAPDNYRDAGQALHTLLAVVSSYTTLLSWD